MDGFTRAIFRPRLKLLHQRLSTLAGYADKVYQQFAVTAYEDGGEVAYKTVVGVQVGSVAPGTSPLTGKTTFRDSVPNR